MTSGLALTSTLTATFVSANLPIRDDLIPNETVLFSFTEAQERVVEEAKAAGFTSTGLNCLRGKHATYKAPGNLVIPFSSKILHEVHKAVTQERSLPNLEEVKAVSLLVPAETGE